jgi:hypothetical protein
MTRGALSFVNSNYPGSFLSDEVFYLSVAGTAVISDTQGSKEERFAADSYPQVSGIIVPGQIGDGVVPLNSAHLPGACQLTIPGVYHSINAPRNFWYGAEDVVDFWLPTFLNGCKRINNSQSFNVGRNDFYSSK